MPISVTPDGTVVSGPAQIEAFYSYVFAHGYGGIPATATIERERVLAPGLVLIDSRFSIGADENAIMAAVIAKQDGVWRIRVLRESRGASAFRPFAP